MGCVESIERKISVIGKYTYKKIKIGYQNAMLNFRISEHDSLAIYIKPLTYSNNFNRRKNQTDHRRRRILRLKHVSLCKNTCSRTTTNSWRL